MSKSLSIIYNGMPKDMDPSQIFDSNKYNTLYACTYSASGAFLKKYCTKFKTIKIIMGMHNKHQEKQMDNALIHIYDQHVKYDDYNSFQRNKFSLFIPKDTIHSKFYLLFNNTTNQSRIITGSANLSFAAFGVGSKQHEDINISDNNALGFDYYYTYYKQYREMSHKYANTTSNESHDSNISTEKQHNENLKYPKLSDDNDTEEKSEVNDSDINYSSSIQDTQEKQSSVSSLSSTPKIGSISLAQSNNKGTNKSNKQLDIKDDIRSATLEYISGNWQRSLSDMNKAYKIAHSFVSYKLYLLLANDYMKTYAYSHAKKYYLIAIKKTRSAKIKSNILYYMITHRDDMLLTDYESFKFLINAHKYNPQDANVSKLAFSIFSKKLTAHRRSYKKQLKICSKYLKLLKNNERYQHSVAKIEQAHGEYNKALMHDKRAVRIISNKKHINGYIRTLCYFHLSFDEYKVNNIKLAITYMQKIATISQYDETAWYKVGHLYDIYSKQPNSDIEECKNKAAICYAKSISCRTSYLANTSIKALCFYHLHLFCGAMQFNESDSVKSLLRKGKLTLQNNAIFYAYETMHMNKASVSQNVLLHDILDIERALTNGIRGQQRVTCYYLISKLCQKGGWINSALSSNHVAILLSKHSNNHHKYVLYQHHLQNYLVRKNNSYSPNIDYTKALKQLIGLKPIKTQIITLANQSMVEKARYQRSGHQEIHMVFEGNPGTGKTTVANLMTGIMYQKGIILKPRLINMDISKVRRKERHWNAGPTVEKKFRDAIGGVLFIDEAYQLEPDSNNDGAAEDIMVPLIKDLELYRDKVVVIMAGYTKKMKHLLTYGNPGLSSRFPKNQRIIFPNYSGNECYKILCLNIRKDKYYIPSQKAKQLLKEYTITQSNLHRTDKNFGNARFVKSDIFQPLINAHDNRIAEKYSPRKIARLGKYPHGKSNILDQMTMSDIKNMIRNNDND